MAVLDVPHIILCFGHGPFFAAAMLRTHYHRRIRIIGDKHYSDSWQFASSSHPLLRSRPLLLRLMDCGRINLRLQVSVADHPSMAGGNLGRRIRQVGYVSPRRQSLHPLLVMLCHTRHDIRMCLGHVLLLPRVFRQVKELP